MNENDVKPVTGIKEQMKGSWMSLFLMIVCLFTMFLVPVFRHSGEAFSQDLGIKIYAKLGWLPLIEVTGMQPIVYDTRIWEMLYYILCEVIIIMKKDIIFLKRVKWELEYMHVVLDPFCYHIYNSKIKRY